jgi:hypothetical protein
MTFVIHPSVMTGSRDMEFIFLAKKDLIKFEP